MTIHYSSYFTESPSASGVFVCDANRPTKPGEMVAYRGTVVVDSNLEIGDKVRFIPMPAGARLYSFAHQWGDLDSATTHVADLGLETTDSNAYLAASTQYRAADTTLASGEGANVLTEFSTELLADAVAAADEDYLTLTTTTAATSLAASATITFQAVIYIP